MQQDSGPVYSEEKSSKLAVPCNASRRDIKHKMSETFKKLLGERPMVLWQAQGWNQSLFKVISRVCFLPTLQCIIQTLQLCLILVLPRTGCCQDWIGGSLGILCQVTAPAPKNLVFWAGAYIFQRITRQSELGFQMPSGCCWSKEREHVVCGCRLQENKSDGEERLC